MLLVCCIIPLARLEHAQVLHVLHYTAPAPISTSMLCAATLIRTSCTMFFHFSEYRCSPNIRLNAENMISTSHLLPYPAFFFHSSRRRFFSSFDIFHTRAVGRSAKLFPDCHPPRIAGTFPTPARVYPDLDARLHTAIPACGHVVSGCVGGIHIQAAPRPPRQAMRRNPAPDMSAPQPPGPHRAAERASANPQPCRR